MKKKYYIIGGIVGLAVLIIAFRLLQAGTNARDRSVKADKDVFWGELAQMNYATKEIPYDLKVLHKKIVRIPGFVVPLTDNIKRIREFLLVPNGMACIHAPPPPPNQMVLVSLGYEMDYDLAYGPVWVTGELLIEDYESPFGEVSYQMQGKNVEAYRMQ